MVGPEAPLALGIADEFRKARLKIFGPTKAAARLESSKSFAKDIMAANRIPTAAARSFDQMGQALAYLGGTPRSYCGEGGRTGAGQRSGGGDDTRGS